MWLCNLFEIMLKNTLIQNLEIKYGCLPALTFIVPSMNLPNNTCFHLSVLVSLISI